VDILFRTKKLGKQCSDDKEAQKAFGKNRANRLRQRLDDLHAAENLETMRHLPGRLHKLVADREGQLSLDLDGPYRLILEPVFETELETKEPVSWTEITAVKSLGIEDTHE
jgi:plasmid maintenance system killer protein